MRGRDSVFGTAKRLADATAEEARTNPSFRRKLRNRALAVGGAAAMVGVPLVATVGVGAQHVSAGSGTQQVNTGGDTQQVNAGGDTQQVNTPGILKAKKSVFRAISFGCGAPPGRPYAYGTAWVYAPHHLITNAHVVAGSSTMAVDRQDGKEVSAKVVFFDPTVDVAVLYAPGIKEPGIPLATKSPSVGDQGAAVGHPGAGPLTVEAATVRANGFFRGLPDANRGESRAKWTVFEGRVRPGNSGGPLIANNGKALGVVTLSDMANTGYAVDIPFMAPELAKAETATNGVSTGQCHSSAPVTSLNSSGIGNPSVTEVALQ